MLRRSRGYAPPRCALPERGSSPLLACGGELKNTFCLVSRIARLGRATRRRPRELRDAAIVRGGYRSLRASLRRAAEVVAHDLHPDYRSTRYALGRTELEPSRVQHHHAHVARCLADTGSTAQRSARSSTAPATAPTARSGVASSCMATSWASSGSRTSAGAPARRRGGRPRTVAHGVRVAGGAREAGAATPRAARGARRPGALGGGRAARPDRTRGAADHEHGPAFRRRGRALRALAPGELRRASGDRVGVARRPG